MAAYPTNPDSVILILWYLDHDYPILKVFGKPGQNLQDQFYLDSKKWDYNNQMILIWIRSFKIVGPGGPVSMKFQLI